MFAPCRLGRGHSCDTNDKIASPLPRWLDEERPVRVGPNAQAVANVGDFVLSACEFTTTIDLVRLSQASWLAHGPSATLRASLACKLWAIEHKKPRHGARRRRVSEYWRSYGTSFSVRFESDKAMDRYSTGGCMAAAISGNQPDFEGGFSKIGHFGRQTGQTARHVRRRGVVTNSICLCHC
jgi:hypothetical protein